MAEARQAQASPHPRVTVVQTTNNIPLSTQYNEPSPPTMSLLRPLLRRSNVNIRLRQLRGLATAVDPTPNPSHNHPRHIAGDRVNLIEVGPRDGLQNEKKTIPLTTKIELIERLAKTGLTDIEAGSFVAPKWVPQVHHPTPSSLLKLTVLADGQFR